MRAHKSGYMLRFKDGRESGLSNDYFIRDIERLFGITTHYLLCNPYPHAKMAKRQFDTGQPIWIKINEDGLDFRVSFSCGTHTIEPSQTGTITIKTTTPDWNIDAEYSLTPFEEEV